MRKLVVFKGAVDLLWERLYCLLRPAVWYENKLAYILEVLFPHVSSILSIS
jgi:hypothetical protein